MQAKTLILIGATASGKTALLAELFGAGAPFEGRAEIISADSMQAYRGMDIGTAKPSEEFRRVLPHHLIDIRDPAEQFSVGDFVRLASEAAQEIRSRGRLPIIAGGTGFYVKNLVQGLPTAPSSEEGLRATVARDLATQGREALRAELAAIDPESARRIHTNDLYRLCRALEIVRATGKPMADFLPEAREPGLSPWLIVEYHRPRAELRERIAARVDAMFEEGLPAELERLRAAGYGAESPGLKAIGYREFLELEAEGLTGAALLEAARQRIKVDTMHYAKRQDTFFRGLAELEVLEAGPGSAAELAALLQPLLAGLGA